MNEKPWGIVVKRLRQPSKYEESFSVHVVKNPGEQEFFTHHAFGKRLAEVKKKFLGTKQLLGNIELTIDPEKKTFSLTDFFPLSIDNAIIKKLEKQGAGLFARKQMVKSLIETHPDWGIKSTFVGGKTPTIKYLQKIGLEPYKPYYLKVYLRILEDYEEELRRKRS